jgi:hypothetical protein
MISLSLDFDLRAADLFFRRLVVPEQREQRRASSSW